MSATLLIVEDEPMIGRILAEKLAREGHEVRRASSVRGLADGVADCDVALVDVTLDEDGIDAMHRLQAGGSAPRAGWLALVESRASEDGARAVRAGAAGVVIKPFKPTAVAAQVTALLAALRR